MRVIEMMRTALKALMGVLASLASLTQPGMATSDSSSDGSDPKSLYLVDLQVLRNQLEIFYIDSGYFTTIENLDDTVSGTPQRPWQAINANGGALVVLPSEGIPRRVIITDWQGPYVTWSGIRQYEEAGGDYDLGAPLDLTGTSSIYLYSPLGLIEPKSGTLSQRYYGDAFNSYAIVTHGANGVFDGNLLGTTAGDDVGIAIPGFQITIPAVSSARRSPAVGKSESQGWTITVRGYNFGVEGGQAAMLLDGTPIDGSIVEWTVNRVVGTLASEPALDSIVSIRLATGALAAQSVPLLAAPEPSSVGDWMFFR